MAVIGAGVMGRGIAQVAAQGGCSVALVDRDDEVLRSAFETIRKNLDGGIARGKLTEADRNAALGLIGLATDTAAAVSNADLVVEAVPEDPELKRAVFAEVAAAAPDTAILATNTSSIQIGDLAGALPHPGRFLGLHFFNPVHIMRPGGGGARAGHGWRRVRAGGRLGRRYREGSRPGERRPRVRLVPSRRAPRP